MDHNYLNKERCKEEIYVEEKAKALKSTMAQIIVDFILMIVWVVILIVRLGKDSTDTFMIILYSICILAFLVSMIVNIVKYRKLKKEQ